MVFRQKSAGGKTKFFNVWYTKTLSVLKAENNCK